MIVQDLTPNVVHAERAFLGFYPELRPRHEMDHRSPPGAERAVAAHPAGDRFGFECEADGAAVTTSRVWLHDGSPLPLAIAHD